MSYDHSNAFTFCPKCGSKGFTSINQGRSFCCEDCKFHYFINNSAAVACLIFNDFGELLLTSRAIDPGKGMLDLPGGFVEPMETIEQAIQREILEELGLEVIDLKYMVSFPNLYPFSNLCVPTVDLAFICQVVSLQNIIPADDVADYLFIPPDKIDFSKLCSRSMCQIIQYYLDNRATIKP